MTRRPFPDIDSPRVLPDRRRPDPWPFIALIALAGIGGFLAWVGLDRQVPVSTNSVSGGGFIRDRGDVGIDSPSQQTQAAVAATELALRLYPEPTQTPRIVTATPTETTIPEQLPICEQAALGEVCLRTAGLVTATPTAGAPWCSELTPSSYGYPQRCKNSAVSTARDEVR